MSEEEYEILPHEEIQKLRQEVKELKKNPMGNVQESEDLKTAMSKLTKAMHNLIDILTKTNDEMVSEFKRTTMSQHFQKISDQNEKIAQALLGMVQLQENNQHQEIEQPTASVKDNIPGIMQTNTQQPTGVDAPIQNPTATSPTTIENNSQLSPNMQGINLPPPEHKRKGLGGMFK